MTTYKVVSRDFPNELWATGFHGDHGKATAQKMIDEGYWYNLMHQQDKHKVLIVVPEPTSTPSKKKKPITQSTYDQKECEFLEYVADFYGPHGIYPMDANGKQIQAAIDTLTQEIGPLCFDSFDREKVRDILIQEHGLVFPTVAQEQT